MGFKFLPDFLAESSDVCRRRVRVDKRWQGREKPDTAMINNRSNVEDIHFDVAN